MEQSTRGEPDGVIPFDVDKVSTLDDVKTKESGGIECDLVRENSALKKELDESRRREEEANDAKIELTRENAMLKAEIAEMRRAQEEGVVVRDGELIRERDALKEDVDLLKNTIEHLLQQGHSQVPLGPFAQTSDRNCEANEEKGDYFPILDFPDELIANVFTFLDVKDRMRARVNKRLSKIEAKSKYYLEKVEFDVGARYLRYGTQYGHYPNAKLNNGERFDFDLIARIAKKTSIGSLVVKGADQEEIVRKFCNVIQDFKNIEALVFPGVVMDDSRFLDLSKKCKSLNITHLSSHNVIRSMHNISLGALLQVFKAIRDDSSSLRSLAFHSGVRNESFGALLNEIGVVYDIIGRRVISNKRNIEAFEQVDEDDDYEQVKIFDGFFHVQFIAFNPDEEATGRRRGDDYRFFKFVLHENLSSLEKAKNLEDGWNEKSVYRQ